MHVKSSANKDYVTKLEAAQRQLVAAIRMFFGQQDELAVHTVASSAYRVIRDLKQHRGQNEVGDLFRNALFFIVQDDIAGTLPKIFSGNKEFIREIRKLARRFRISESSTLGEVTVSLSEEFAREWWRDHNAPSNFLKHADRDPDAHLSLDTLDNLTLLMQTYQAYLDIAGDIAEPGPEGKVLSTLFGVTNGWVEHVIEECQDHAKHLEQLGKDDRIAYCEEWLKEMTHSSRE